MLTNPLDMSGPEFLMFYLIAGALTLLFVRYRIHQQESQWNVPRLNLTDPYEIALLRGGENEALRIAALSLIDRGLLEVSNETIKTKNKEAVDKARRSIEKAILRKFSSAAEAHEMYNDDTLKAACTEYRTSLGQQRLIANAKVLQARRPLLWVGLIILGGLAGAKLAVALLHGKTNVLFLIILAVVFLFYLFKFYNRERTSLGDRVLKDLQTLFQGLKDRSSSIRSGGETNEAALLAAIFGASALSVVNFPYIEKLFPKASKFNSTYGTYSCNSSCASSCGGGGGCGGCGGN